MEVYLCGKFSRDRTQGLMHLRKYVGLKIVCWGGDRTHIYSSRASKESNLINLQFCSALPAFAPLNKKWLECRNRTYWGVLPVRPHESLSTQYSIKNLVEVTVFEPMTSCLQSRRSTNWAIPPKNGRTERIWTLASRLSSECSNQLSYSPMKTIHSEDLHLTTYSASTPFGCVSLP